MIHLDHLALQPTESLHDDVDGPYGLGQWGHFHIILMTLFV